MRVTGRLRGWDMEEEMYHVVVFTRTDDNAVWMSVLKNEEDAQELIRLVSGSNSEGLLIQDPIEVERINFI